MTRKNRNIQAEQHVATGRYDEIGSTGLAQFSGQIQDDFLREMRGVEAYKRYDEMRRNSPVIGALLLAIEQSIRGISWEFESADGEEDPRLDLLNDARLGMSHSWNDHIAEALTMLPFGFSLFEIVYKRDNRGRVVWRKFAPRGQDTIRRWLFDDEGGLAGVEQQQRDYSLKTLPVEKLLLYRMRVERNNPEGRSVLRTAWIPYYFAKHAQQIEGIGFERDLAGLPVITLPPNADTSSGDSSDLGKAKKIVRNVRNDDQAGIVLPSPDWKFELVSTGGNRQFDTDKIINRYESRMLMACLAQFLMLGQESVGSFSLSKDQTDFFTMSVNATADILAETFAKYAIPRLLKLNGYAADGISLNHSPAGDLDLIIVADFLQKVGAYITWSAQDEAWLRQVARLPQRSEQDIQAERDKKQAAENATRHALLERMRQPGDSQPGEEDASEDDMSVEMYDADAPDDKQRRKREREWEKALTDYFDGARRRVLAAARDMKAGQV